MKRIAEIVARKIVTLNVKEDEVRTAMCREVAEGLREIFPDDKVPASEVFAVEELFLIRVTCSHLEQLLGLKGMFIDRGEDRPPVAHPALAGTLRHRERFRKIWDQLAWRHGVAGFKPVRLKMVTPGPRVERPERVAEAGGPVVRPVHAPARDAASDTARDVPAKAPSKSPVVLPLVAPLAASAKPGNGGAVSAGRAVLAMAAGVNGAGRKDILERMAQGSGAVSRAALLGVGRRERENEG